MQKKLNSLNMVLEAKSRVWNCWNHFQAQRLRIFEYVRVKKSHF